MRAGAIHLRGYAPLRPMVVGAVLYGAYCTAIGAVISATSTTPGPSVARSFALIFGIVVVPVVFLTCAYVLVARARVKHCSFCGYAIQGPTAKSTIVGGVAICERCAPRAVERNDWVEVAAAFPSRTPWAVSSPVIKAMVARASGHEELRAAKRRAWHMDNWSAAESALSNIAEAARTPLDWVELGCVVGWQHRYEEALALTRRAEVALMGRRADYASATVMIAVNIAWFSAKVAGGRGRGGSGADAARWMRAVDEAARTLEARTLESTEWDWWFMHAAAARAELSCLAGDLDHALASLEGVAAKFPSRLSNDFLLCRAKVHAARGASAEAIGDLEAALRHLHPESKDADEARDLLKSLSP